LVNRTIGLPLAAGLLSAVLFVSLPKGIPGGMALCYAAPLPLLMAGLMLGVGASLLAGIFGALAVGVVIAPLAALPFAVAAALPAVLISGLAQLGRAGADGGKFLTPPGSMVCWLAVMGMALVVAGSAVAPPHEGGVEGYVAEMIGRTLDMVAPEAPAEQRAKASAFWAPLFPAMVAGSWLLMSVLNATAAQGILAQLGRARRPSPDYAGLELPRWSGLVLALAFAVGVAAEGDVGYVARNLAVVASAPFAFLGTAVIHRWSGSRPRRRLLLGIFYGFLFLAFVWAAPVVAGLGIAKYLTYFRRPTDGASEE
jgi:hypothetical protein